MKFLIKKEAGDPCGDSWKTTPKEKPLPAAYQDTYTVREIQYHVKPTTVRRTNTVKIIDGEEYVKTQVEEITSDTVVEWLEDGYGHQFDQSKYKDTDLHLTRYVEQTGWFIDIDSLEKLCTMINNETITSSIEPATEYNIVNNFCVITTW